MTNYLNNHRIDKDMVIIEKVMGVINTKEIRLKGKNGRLGINFCTEIPNPK